MSVRSTLNQQDKLASLGVPRSKTAFWTRSKAAKEIVRRSRKSLLCKTCDRAIRSGTFCDTCAKALKPKSNEELCRILAPWMLRRKA